MAFKQYHCVKKSLSMTEILFYILPGVKRPAQMTARPDGTYDIVYYPEIEGKCQVEVKYAGQPVPNRLVKITGQDYVKWIFSCWKLLKVFYLDCIVHQEIFMPEYVNIYLKTPEFMTWFSEYIEVYIINQ